MAVQVQRRRGTTAEHSTFTGAAGEITIDTDKDTVVVHDGATAGGHPLAKEAALSSYVTTASIGVTVQGYDADTAKLDVAQTWSALQTLNGGADLGSKYTQTVVAVAALDIDCSLGNYFTKTINADSTFTVSNVPAGRAYAFTLEITHTSGAITWFAGVEWPKGTAPSLTTGKTHVFVFVTDDGGTRWRGAALVDYTN